MQKALFPMKYVSVSQRCNTTGSHKNLEAIDINGMDSGIDHGRAPCCIKVLAVLRKDITGFNNTVLYGTCDKNGNKSPVLLNNGKKKVLTFAFTHDNYIKDLKVGMIFNQLDICYQEGTVGQATGNHIHLEVGEGWQTHKYKDAHGNWALKDLICPGDVFWLLEGYHEVCNRGLNGYNFPWTKSGDEDVIPIIPTPVIPEPTIPDPVMPEPIIPEPSNPTPVAPAEDVRSKFIVKCIKASSSGKHPTRLSVNGLISTNKQIDVGDILEIDLIKTNLRKETMMRIKKCKSSKWPFKNLTGRWFKYDSNHFKKE